MFKKLNKRAEKLTLMDVKLLQLSVFSLAIIAVKLIPRLLRINYSVLAIFMFVCLAKPLYSFWFKRSSDLK